MKTLAIELRKEKRTGVIPVLLAVGILELPTHLSISLCGRTRF